MCLCGVPVPKVVRSGLVVPLQFAGLGFESEDAIGVKIVAHPLIAVIVFTWISGLPKNQVGLRIVDTCEPCDSTAMLNALPFPGFRTRLARRGHRPESPCFFAGILVVA